MCIRDSSRYLKRHSCFVFFFFQAEDGIRDRSPSRGLGDVYKRQTHDFTSFRGQNSVPSSPIRHIHRIDLKRSNKGIHLFVTGEGFLYHMVRNMAGALADIGRGKLSREDIPDILQAKDRKRLGVTAPAKGLCLLKVYFQPITNNEIDNTLQGNYFPWSI